MKNLVVPHFLVNDLLSIGYDEETYFYYNQATTGVWELDEVIWESSDNVLPGILWTQAFDWFNEKYNLYSFIENFYNKDWIPKIVETKHPKKINREKLLILERFNSIYEARIGCLKHLIKIVKDDNI